MSLRKPILKVTRKCPKCNGDGKEEDIYFGSYQGCKKCVGLGRVDVKQDDPKFKKYYQEALEKQVDFLTTEYRYATSKAFEMGEELRKHCKELDKVVNK